MSRQAVRHATPVDLAPAMQRDQLKSAHIRDVVLQAGEDLRTRHPWLRRQDQIGASILLLSVAAMAALAWAYTQGLVAWWACIPLTAFFASFIHELEHDLIHQMYFRHRPWVNRLMMAVGWLARPNAVNPFVRRALHLHHHKYSGTASDLEERGIANGSRWGLGRLLGTIDNPLGLLLRLRDVTESERLYKAMQQPTTGWQRWALRHQQHLVYFPMGLLYYPPLYLWAGWHAWQWLAPQFGLNTAGAAPSEAWRHGMALLDTYAVVMLLPNTLRGFCLYFLSSNLHYYGDIDSRNVIQQCQVLNAWWLWPFQLFCCNFGSTHAIHHFAVKEPFYVRQWTAPVAHAAMRDAGVRFNDMGTFLRANRWGPTTLQRAH
ncbi:MAG: hypothetical protein RI907_2764 [Pseudomonadota bacterium]|jgi:fatty acid desaturase